MGLFEAVLVFALVLAVLGIALPSSVVGIVDPILGVYLGNELLFLSGFLFTIASNPAGDDE